MDTARLPDRARRLGQVKFMALPLDEPARELQETASPAAHVSRGGWLRRLLGCLPFRGTDPLEAARP